MHSNVFQIGLKQDMQPVTEDVVLESRLVFALRYSILPLTISVRLYRSTAFIPHSMNISLNMSR